LLHANGWPAFYQAVDLYGTGDLLGNMRGIRGAEMLSFIEGSVLAESGLRREDLLPIAVSSTDLDLFVMVKHSAKKRGMVVWFAGYEVDRFQDFSEFFSAMVEYNRQEVRHFQG
jgi:hypothetical protein